jgi:hypothetical protein
MSQSNDKAKAAMCEKNSMNLNAGAPHYPRSPHQNMISAETKAKLAKTNRHPDR